MAIHSICCDQASPPGTRFWNERPGIKSMRRRRATCTSIISRRLVVDQGVASRNGAQRRWAAFRSSAGYAVMAPVAKKRSKLRGKEGITVMKRPLRLKRRGFVSCTLTDRDGVLR